MQNTLFFEEMGAFNKLHFDSETVLHSGIHKQENMREEVDTHISY